MAREYKVISADSHLDLNPEVWTHRTAPVAAPATRRVGPTRLSSIHASSKTQTTTRTRRSACCSISKPTQRTARYVLDAKVPSVATFVPCEGEVTAFIRPRDAYAKKAAAKLAEPLWSGDDAWEIEGTERTKRVGESLKQMMKDHGLDGEALAVDQVDSAVVLSMIEAGLRVVPARPVVELARWGTSQIKAVDPPENKLRQLTSFRGEPSHAVD